MGRLRRKTKTGKREGEVGARLPCAAARGRQLGVHSVQPLDKLPEWEANGIVPTEPMQIQQYESWTSDVRDDSLARCLFAASAAVPRITAEVLAELALDTQSEVERAALAYLGIALDKLLNYNSPCPCGCRTAR